MTEQVNHPSHYNSGPKNADGTAVYEAIKVIEDWGAGFCSGNALKYISRAAYKGTPKQDLEKALWYLRRNSDEFSSNQPEGALLPEDVALAWGLNLTLSKVITCIYRSLQDHGDQTPAAEALAHYIDDEGK
jgi:hypothetical protein